MPGATTSDPKDVPAVFKANFDAGLIDVMVAGYAEDGAMDLGGGRIFRGRPQIREALAGFLQSGLPIHVTPGPVLASGDVAVVMFDWSVRGTGPDGAPVEMGGGATDVLRKEGDGVWRQVLDLPFGRATPAG